MYIDDDAKPGEPRNFDVLPKGRYLAAIEEGEVKENSKGTGDKLDLMWDIIEPVAYKGRKVFQNINIRHDSKKCQDIGQSEFAAVRQSTGILRPNDPVELKGIPCCIFVGIESAQNGYPAKNEVTGVKPAAEFSAPPKAAQPAGNNGQAPAASRPMSSPAAPPVKGPAPWKAGKANPAPGPKVQTADIPF